MIRYLLQLSGIKMIQKDFVVSCAITMKYQMLSIYRNRGITIPMSCQNVMEIILYLAKRPMMTYQSQIQNKEFERPQSVRDIDDG